MPPHNQRGNDTGERVARLEYASDHNAQDIRDLWDAMGAMRDLSSKADMFIMKADEVLRRVDQHTIELAAIKDELAETKGRRTIFHSMVAFGASIVGGLFVHFFPGSIAGGH
jgi:hypothetical protein